MDVMVVEICPRCGWVNPALRHTTEWSPKTGPSSWGLIVLGALCLVAVTAYATLTLTGQKIHVPSLMKKVASQGEGAAVAASDGQEPTGTEAEKSPAAKKSKKKRKGKKRGKRKYNNHPCNRLIRKCQSVGRQYQKYFAAKKPNPEKRIKLQIQLQICTQGYRAISQISNGYGWDEGTNKEVLDANKDVCKVTLSTLKDI